MFDLLWHLRGSVPLNRIESSDSALDRVQRMLKKQRKSTIHRSRDSVTFDDSLWNNAFGPDWHAMALYDRGRFWIEQDKAGRSLRYDLRSFHGLVFCLFAAFVAFFLGLADNGLSNGLKYGAGAFAWLYGMNILLALARVPGAIRRAARAD